MIDNVIIKAVEWCPLDDIGGCRKIDALSLINRQKTEIERLKKHLQFAEELYCRKEMTEDEGK